MADDSHQGRVQSLMQLSFAGFGIAAAPLGLLAEAIGLRQAIGVMGGVALVVSGIYYGFEISSAGPADGTITLDVTPLPRDYGDAPNSYLTLKASGGATHVIDMNLFMGTNAPDADTDGFGDGIEDPLRETNLLADLSE